MIDCVRSIEKENLRKVVNREKRVKREKTGGKERRGWEIFHGLHVTLPMHTRTTAALECGHLPLQVRRIKLLFPTKKTRNIFE